MLVKSLKFIKVNIVYRLYNAILTRQTFDEHKKSVTRTNAA